MLLSCDVAMKYEDTLNDLTLLVRIETTGDGALRPTLVGGKVHVE